MEFTDRLLNKFMKMKTSIDNQYVILYTIYRNE